MILKIALFFSIFRQTVADNCSNGAGGSFSCNSTMSDQEIARGACESVYSSCQKGACGKFKYYYGSGHVSCGCKKPIGQYEFIYSNTGYNYVGSDYSGNVDEVAGNGLFVRKKTFHSCGSTSWKLVLSFTSFPTASPTEKPTSLSPTEKPTSLSPTEKPTSLPTRIPCKDQFTWCVFPNICDDFDFRPYCPFSCDDCRTASPTSMPTRFPTEECAAREDLLEAVIDHMLNYYD